MATPPPAADDAATAPVDVAVPPPAAVVALREVILVGEQFRHAVADHLGVSLSETIAMSHLSVAEPVSPRELATHIGLTPSTVTALLDRLEAANLAVRQAHPTDRRKSVIVITEHGHDVLTRVREWLGAAVSKLDQDQLPQITVLLTAVATALSTQTTAVKASAPQR